MKVLFLSLILTGCSTIYYETWETLGKQKRDLLRDNIEDARDDQKDVQEELKDALTHIRELYGLDGGDLEKAYDRAKDDYEDAQSRAQKLSDRVKKVEEIGADLFEEWEDEAKSISSDKMRQDSLAKLAASKAKFKPMVAAMKGTEKSIEPVMTKLRDQMLYLKHNLNAQALGSLKKEMGGIEKDVAKLIRDMEKSIAQSESFIKTLE